MPEDDVIGLGFHQHLLKCPHCQEQTVHHWPGTMILFAKAKCTHCGRDFLIALNQARRSGAE